ncbi:hypothetical protein [Eubacterium sp.]|uniref:cobaltochelatase CobT-related protein n=1 Tax=Eubacterium sp. TaxID=142586 RepID=UPI00258FAD73|nr:hypothetical protein [Eubacterium sp.]MCR5367879.1 hypothetical protein [Eubacterium sp.]
MKLEKTNEEWEAEKRFYEAIYASKLENETKIIEIMGSDDLGFTSKDEKIHIAREHAIMENLSEDEKRTFRAGVFCHEMLHQIFTDFGYLEELMDITTGEKEKSVLGLMINLIEDPAIEHFAPEAVGGTLLKSLNFAINHIYNNSVPITPDDKVFSQVVTALIHFGDVGLVKGDMSEEAFEYFRKISPKFDKAIKTTSSRKRMDMAKEWTEILRPLWESDEEIEETCNEIMSGNGMSNSAGNSSKEPEEPQDSSSRDETSQRREESLRKMSEDDSFCPKDKEEKRESDLNAKDFEEILNHIYDNMSEFEKELYENRVPAEIPEISMPEFPDVRSFVERVESDDIKTYNALKKKVSKDIGILVRSMRNIFRNEIDEEIWATSGSYNIQRDIKKSTVKIFDKRKERNKVDDLSVMVLVDESGSMNGYRIEMARDAAIMLTEAFSALKIPCSVIGFTADMDNYDVVHSHYVSWSNLAKERISLCKMSAKCNNFDAYSVRYAGKLLQKTKSEKKLLIVISDGLPLCRMSAGKLGVEETTKAIREMSRKSKILGIGIGKNDETFNKMYNGHFVSTTPDQLSSEIIRQLKICIK